MKNMHGDRTNQSLTVRTSRRGAVLAALASACLVACGGTSNSEVKTDAGASGQAGTTGSAGSVGSTGSAGSAGSAGSTGSAGSAGTSGAAGSGASGTAGMGAAGATGAAGSGASCPAHTAFTLAVHIVLDVTWPATAATGMGTGKVHLWNRAKLNANGLALTGDTWSCGTILPEFALNFAGSVVTGGSKVSIDVPNSVWDAPMIPKFPNMGTLTGWDAGSKIEIMPTIALVGLTMADPMAAWPMSYTGIMARDDDSDGNPGFTAVPKQGGGYVAPPTGQIGRAHV